MTFGIDMADMTIGELIEHLKTYPQDADITFASVTAWTKDGALISWDRIRYMVMNNKDNKMDDTISRRAAIDTLHGYLVGKRCPDDGTLTCRLIENEVINKLPPAQPNITHIIMDTLAECGIYGEEATIKLIGTLKRIGRDDLIPPCAR